jgi:flagellar hook protein FlgE
MSITGSMFTASTALNTFGNSISLIGDNIDNLNTVGFKTSRSAFADLLPTVRAEIETGHGVRLADVGKPFQQGAMETTPNVTDLAVEGNGFFIVANATTGTSYYTRAGQFHLDSTGKLVNEAGLALQGSSGDIVLGSPPDIPAQATSIIALRFNLDASSTTPPASFPSTLDASASAWTSASNFSSVTTVYDDQGNAHDLNFLFRKIAPDTWEYRVVAHRSELDPSAPASSEWREVATPGSLVFTSNGQLDTAASTLTDISGLTWLTGGSQSIPAGSLNFAGTEQYAQPSALLASSQDGYGVGTFEAFTIDEQGGITGRFSNGTSTTLGTIALANFANVDDLDPQGDTLFLPSVESGAAQTGTPNQAGLGSIRSGSLELSTVDLAQQFVLLISSQRAFQVNSKIITTADQMYAEAANLKA